MSGEKGTEKIRIRDSSFIDIERIDLRNFGVAIDINNSANCRIANNKIKIPCGGYGIVSSRNKYDNISDNDISCDCSTNDKYMFRWDAVPGSDETRLKNKLAEIYCIDWINNAKIEKIKNNNIIRIFTNGKSISLKLNDERTQVAFEIDNKRIGDFVAKTKNDKLNIYENSISEGIVIDDSQDSNVFNNNIIPSNLPTNHYAVENSTRSGKIIIPKIIDGLVVRKKGIVYANGTILIYVQRIARRKTVA